MPSARAGFAQKIAAFREALGLSQEEFAKALAVKRLAVLMWEKENGGREPSVQNCVRLAKLAQNAVTLRPSDAAKFAPFALWFWKEAGVGIADLRALVPEIDKSLRQHEKRIGRPQPGEEAVHLPLLSESVFRGGHDEVMSALAALATDTAYRIEEYIAFPSSVIPNRHATFCVRAPNDYMRPIFRQGDVVAIDFSLGVVVAPDGSGDAMKELAGFNDLVKRVMLRPEESFSEEVTSFVAAYHTEQQGPKRPGLRPGLHLRRIWLSGHGMENVHLESEVGRHITGSPPEYLRDPRTGRYGEGPSKWTKWEQEAEHVVITADAEWSILGRAVAWIGSNLGPLRDLDKRSEDPPVSIKPEPTRDKEK